MLLSTQHPAPSPPCRCGVLMAVRSLLLDAPTGICITASHNPAPDNGVKLVEPTGEMLTRSWEVGGWGQWRREPGMGEGSY